MFGPSFVTQIVEPTTAGNPSVVATSVTWASHVMLHHIATYNAVFATIQLLIAVGLFFRRTRKAALAASIVWALSVWWFGESLGGILIGSSPFSGVPGGAVLYAFIAVLLWPTGAPSVPRPISPATSGPLGATVPKLAWLALWGSFTYYLLLPANRSSEAIGQIFAVTDGQPGWITSIMNALSHLAGHRGTEISVVVAAGCALVALGVFAAASIRPALVVAAALGLLFWIAEGAGGIFTGQGTDPNTGLILVLLAACFWPYAWPAAYGVACTELGNSGEPSSGRAVAGAGPAAIVSSRASAMGRASQSLAVAMSRKISSARIAGQSAGRWQTGRRGS
jgi:hypothetical protein